MQTCLLPKPRVSEGVISDLYIHHVSSFYSILPSGGILEANLQG